MSTRSPLYSIEKARGAHFIDYSAREIAEHHGNPRAEYEAVRSDAGALDLCYLGKLRALGRDRVRFLHNMLSNNIKGLGPGAGCYATLLTRQGKMESDLYLYAFPEEMWMECPPAGSGQVLETLGRHIVGDVVQIDDWSDRLAVLSLQGPQSRSKMESSTGSVLTGLPPLSHITLPKATGDWVIIHRDRTGCDGYDLWLPVEDAAEVWARWLDSDGIRPVGHEALNWLRTEAGIPWFGVDMDARHLPMEFGLDSAISLTKGCYRGQEIVARVVHRGHLDRHLAGIAFRSGKTPPRGTDVHVKGTNVGEITSVTFSPRLDCPLALAILKSEFLMPGTAVETICDYAICPGEVVALPVAQPGK